jgi:hypothetical protein
MDTKTVVTNIQVRIATPHWLKRKVIYLSKEFASFFPADALGARGEPELHLFPARGVPVTFDYAGSQSTCDIATDKAGKMRPRDTGPIGTFFKNCDASVGDYVTISKGEGRTFHIGLVKANDAAV